MKITLIFLTLLFCLPQKDAGKIPWEENRKLRWEDFREKPISNAGFAASTTSGISFSYSFSMEKNKVNVEYSVNSFFIPEKSWFIPSLVNQHILDHEQTHFDITELHARILRKRLDKKKFSQKAKSEIETIYRQTEQQRKAMQMKFDAETDHSRNEKKEIQWRIYIAKQLADYDEWR